MRIRAQFILFCLVALGAVSARAAEVDWDAIVRTIESKNDIECASCELEKPSPTLDNEWSCAGETDTLSAGAAYRRDWAELLGVLKISPSPALSEKAEAVAQQLDGLIQSDLPAFEACLAGRDSSPDRSACAASATRVLDAMNKLVILEAAVRRAFCATKPKPDSELALRLGVYSTLLSRIQMSRGIFRAFAPHIDAMYGSAASPAAKGAFANILRITTERTALIKEGYDWLRVRKSGKKSERRQAEVVLARAEPTLDCFQAELGKSILQLKKNGRSKAQIKKLTSALRDLQVASKKAMDPKHHEAYRKRRLNVITILGNLTWGLPNTAVGGVVSLMSLVTNPVAGSDTRKALPNEVKPSQSGKQLRITSRMLHRNGRGRDASLGMFEIDSGSTQTGKGHEGGHAVQSAILGPFYFPALGVDYLLHGHAESSLEGWADEIGLSTFPEKPEIYFGCDSKGAEK